MRVLPITNGVGTSCACKNTNFKAEVKLTIPARQAVKENFINPFDKKAVAAVECLWKASEKFRKMIRNKYPVGEEVVIDKLSKEELTKVKRAKPNFNPQLAVRMKDKYVDFFYDYGNVTKDNVESRSESLANNFYNAYAHLCKLHGQKPA